jgi:alpha-tubulin suppressor-like RCC1 family protein
VTTLAALGIPGGVANYFADRAVDVDVGGAVSQVSAGSSHTCAVLDSGGLRCWGTSNTGQLGYGDRETIGNDEHPVEAGDVEIGGAVRQVAAGPVHSCAVLEQGGVRCWGLNDTGQLGYGHTRTIGDDETPSEAGDVELGGPAVSVCVQTTGACALMEGGGVRCWGEGFLGQLGYGNQETIGDDETPLEAGEVELGGEVVRLECSGHGACALLADGSVRCWGSGRRGFLGNGINASIGDDELPIDTPEIEFGGTAVDLSVGNEHVCVRIAEGGVRCWGANAEGQLGNGTTSNVLLAEAAEEVQLGGDATELALGFDNSCALMTTGALNCWGSGSSGQLGHGNTESVGDDETPAPVGNVPLE